MGLKKILKTKRWTDEMERSQIDKENINIDKIRRVDMIGVKRGYERRMG